MQVPNFLNTYKGFNMHLFSLFFLFSLEDDNIFKVYIILKYLLTSEKRYMPVSVTCTKII